MRRSFAKNAKASKKRNGFPAVRVLVGLALLFYCWLTYLTPFSGRYGRMVDAWLEPFLGATRYAVPIVMIHGFVRFLRAEKGGGIIHALSAAGSILALAAFLGLLAGASGGGAVGLGAAGMLRDGLGGGAYLLSLGCLLVGLQLVFGIRWSRVAAEASRLVADDFRDWQRSRKELAEKMAKVKPPMIEKTVVAKQVNGNGHVDGADERTAVRRVEELKEERPKAKAPAAATTPRPAQVPADSPYANYKLPPLELLNPTPTAHDRGKPSEAEIQAAVVKLEATLKSFDVEAHVTGYAPGPVITRYELAPATGVKVSSIVALENDIALAMSAKGIRIIAPIPGKAAVGIEIPNARPALVVLREILESPAALPADAPLLSFGLGLSAAGEAKSADLQKMPHVLVAGATNSGKSVAIHAMILSILFRARPDEVKFLMIDPKRLELTFYDGIPHLFDPTAAAERVQVITNSKDAAKALHALVRLMEKRYEKFQLYSVRNIDSYNKEADKRGEPREFFIVVVIDELADLMLIAADTVEDSIQRLTQMARAVGIHLVLATQRPSVDVITGVIKANLPSRIALQVISKIDSKVILDGSGAEALQGRGDLLYLAAGSQKPERCQGAYVTEEEISRVAKHLREQGKPSYPALETMAPRGGAADDLASLGVEPLEFSQALKLVLERRRVSQDLLKSQFGSSARATNLLSALEVKELIHKPEGSNRWEIHFDQIEDYLRAHFPQVPLDKPGI